MMEMKMLFKVILLIACIGTVVADSGSKKEEIDAKKSLDNYMHRMKNSIEDMEQDDKSTIKDSVTDTFHWLNANSHPEKEDFEGKLKELQFIFDPIISKIYQGGHGAEMDDEFKEVIKKNHILETLLCIVFILIVKMLKFNNLNLNIHTLNQMEGAPSAKCTTQAQLDEKGRKMQEGIQKVENKFDQEKKEGYIRFVCISDTHCDDAAFENVPDGDVLIHAGDFTATGATKQVEKFVRQLNTLKHPIKVVIAGNHDIPFDTEKWSFHRDALVMRFRELKYVKDQPALKEMVKESCTHYLEDTACEVHGYKIWGSPWSPWFYDWGFNLRRGPEIKAKWDLIPDETDILITHGPPLGHGDRCEPAGNYAGCEDLLDVIQNRVKPMYNIFGHIHEGYGITTDSVTTYINASSLNEHYESVNTPVVFDLPIKK